MGGSEKKGKRSRGERKGKGLAGGDCTEGGGGMVVVRVMGAPGHPNELK